MATDTEILDKASQKTKQCMGDLSDTEKKRASKAKPTKLSKWIGKEFLKSLKGTRYEGAVKVEPKSIALLKLRNNYKVPTELYTWKGNDQVPVEKTKLTHDGDHLGGPKHWVWQLVSPKESIGVKAGSLDPDWFFKYADSVAWTYIPTTQSFDIEAVFTSDESVQAVRDALKDNEPLFEERLEFLISKHAKTEPSKRLKALLEKS